MIFFVAHFDTNRGNQIEWKYPEDADLRGVEFNVLPSGAHETESDTIYFSCLTGYGLASFGKRAACAKERGARMKAVGVIQTDSSSSGDSTYYSTLYRHLPFLQFQLQQSLDGTVDYQELISYARASRCYDSIEQSTRNHSPPISTAPISLVDLCSGHPLIGLVDFVQFFGIQIFTLWKYSLLRRRIIFLTSCPVDSACTYVYATFILATNRIPVGFSNGSKPLFCVSLHDLDRLQLLSSTGYVACTTDKIYQSKTNLYELFVDCDSGNIQYSADYTDSKYLINNADKNRWEQMWEYAVNKAVSPTRSEQRPPIIRSMIRTIRRRQRNANTELNSKILRAIEEIPTENLCFDLIEYFTRLNTMIFENLINLASSSRPILRQWHLEQMGLDPQHDCDFIIDIIHSHDIPIKVDYLKLDTTSPTGCG